MSAPHDPTRLEALMRRVGVRPAALADAVTRIGRRLGIRISRNHLIRIRYGRMKPTEEKIRLIVSAMRELTGLTIRATDLFFLEPAAPGFHGAGSLLSLSSGQRFLMPDEDAQTPSERLEAMYYKHAPLLRTTARLRHHIPPGDVDALVHDVFASFLERQPHANDVRAYLLGAINNACLNYWRKRQNEAPLLTEHDQTSDTRTSEQLDRWALHLSLGATLASLGAKCRETLSRYYYQGEKPAAIAKSMDTTPGYVFQLLHACRKRARDIYRKLTEPGA